MFCDYPWEKQAKEASRRYEEEAVMQLWMDIFQTVMKA